MATNRPPRTRPARTSRISLQNQNPNRIVLYRERLSSDEEDEKTQPNYQSPDSRSLLGDNICVSSRSHLSGACMTGVVSTSTTVTTPQTTFAETLNGGYLALAQNRVSHAEYLYQESTCSNCIGSNRHAVQETFELEENSGGSSLRTNNPRTYARQPQTFIWDSRAPPAVHNFETLEAALHIADKKLPVHAAPVCPPSNIDVVMAPLGIGNDPLAFKRLFGYCGKKNNQQLFDCFYDCEWHRLGAAGFRRRANLLAHLRNCHSQNIPKFDRRRNRKGEAP